MNPKKITNILALLVIISFITACNKSKNTSTLNKDPWSYEEKVDKISGVKTYISSAILTDDMQPEKSVETEITCDSKDMYIQVTLHTKNLTKADSQSNIESTKSKDLLYAMLRLRSGENKFRKIAMVAQSSNQAIIFMKDPEGSEGSSYGIINNLSGGLKKSIFEELVGNELFIEIPSKYGSPVVSINLESPSVQKIFNVCGIVPPYMKRTELLKETVITPTSESTNSTPSSELVTLSKKDNQPQFSCNTEKHTILINKIDAANYRYRSWNKPKSIDEKADMDLISKDISTDGTGSMRATTYVFSTGNVQIRVDDNSSLGEGKPPANAIGNLNVYISNQLKNHYYCLK